MADLIDRQAAKNEIARFAGYLDDDMILRLQIAVDKLPPFQLEQKWIPVTERLPEDGAIVFVTIYGHDCIRVRDRETLTDAFERIRQQVRYTSFGFHMPDGWNNIDGFPMIVEPVAWMPLPEPYKEVEG